MTKQNIPFNVDNLLLRLSWNDANGPWLFLDLEAWFDEDWYVIESVETKVGINESEHARSDFLEIVANYIIQHYEYNVGFHSLANEVANMEFEKNERCVSA